MRKCLRCNSDMAENLDLRTNDGMGMAVCPKSFFKGAVGRVSVAVCPECGYVEQYLENTEKLKKYMQE